MDGHELIAKRFAADGVTGVKVINGGISGSTSASGLSRLQWYIREQPKVLFLALGVNDGLRGLSMSMMSKHLNDVITAAIGQGMTVVLAGMELPPN